MIEFDYLYQGICGLANAHRAGTMAGHLGAAVAAGYLISEDQPDLPDEVYRGIEGELDRIIRGEEAIWYNAKKAGVTPTELFAAMPDENPQAKSIDSIAAALAENIGQTRQSGHNVIFAAIAIRALRDHPEYATPAIVAGIRKLTLGFNGAHPGRGYYGKEKQWLTGDKVKLPPDDDLAAYRDLPDMANTVIGDLINQGQIRRQGFGGLWHVINHAAALIELSRFGYRELARQGLPAQHHHVRLWRSLPDVEAELGPYTKADHDPREPAYWQGMLKRDEARLTHRIKTIYGFQVLLTLIDDGARRAAARDAFRYLMA
ncbi:MAG: hypothetical protein KDA42_00795 [Planctomycetales bacterium]|nr:hypothetical protein [Planctomycetales bacterium]